MTFQTSKDSALHFLDTLKIQNLICWNKKYIDKEYFDNYGKFEIEF